MTSTSKSKFIRQFPIIRDSLCEPVTPITFVVVRFSEEINHNLLISKCVKSSINQLVVIDNTSNIHYKSLASAINAGIKKSENDIIVIIHEDVYLPVNWHSRLEVILNNLEKNDNNWGIIGPAGLSFKNTMIGHFSDPRTYCNNLSSKLGFEEVYTLDEHLMIIKKSSGLELDEKIPGIHGIGIDLKYQAKQNGMKTYVIDAPSVHKYKNSKGDIIYNYYQSDKIVDRQNYAYIADKECCDDYISYKWESFTPFKSIVSTYETWIDPAEKLKKIPPEILEYIDNPIIMLGKGGGGSRLLSHLIEDFGVCIGNNVNISGDCLDMVIPIYKAVIIKYATNNDWQKESIIPMLRLAAAEMLLKMHADSRNKWGFKLPENLFFLPELNSAFPNAKFIQMYRNPVDTCLRRTHMTARLDNQIGRVTLPLAYSDAGIDVNQIFKDEPVIHMARTTLHQLKMSIDFCRENFHNEKYLEVYFEDVLLNPTDSMEIVKSWINAEIVGNKLVNSIDKKRASNPGAYFDTETAKQVRDILNPILSRLEKYG